MAFFMPGLSNLQRQTLTGAQRAYGQAAGSAQPQASGFSQVTPFMGGPQIPPQFGGMMNFTPSPRQMGSPQVQSPLMTQLQRVQRQSFLQPQAPWYGSNRQLSRAIGGLGQLFGGLGRYQSPAPTPFGGNMYGLSNLNQPQAPQQNYAALGQLLGNLFNFR